MADTLKAYEVRDDWEGNCVIRFAKSNAQARREGAAELEIDWDQVEHCRRRPQYDCYAPGAVPMMVRLADGWWFECHHCGRKIEEEDYGYDDGEYDEPLDPVEVGSAIYCTPACRGMRGAWLRGRAAAESALCELIQVRWPNASIRRVHVYGDRLEPSEYRDGLLVGGIKCSAHFDLPGLQYGVDYHFGDDKSLFVANADLDAFKAAYGAPND